jgi:hypothetical protein
LLAGKGSIGILFPVTAVGSHSAKKHHDTIKCASWAYTLRLLSQIVCPGICDWQEEAGVHSFWQETARSEFCFFPFASAVTRPRNIKILCSVGIHIAPTIEKTVPRDLREKGALALTLVASAKKWVDRHFSSWLLSDVIFTRPRNVMILSRALHWHTHCTNYRKNCAV